MGRKVTYKEGIGLDKYNTNRIELGFKYRIKAIKSRKRKRIGKILERRRKGWNSSRKEVSIRAISWLRKAR